MNLNNKIELFEEAKALLTTKDILDNDCISLYSISTFLRNQFQDCLNVRKKYKKILESNLRKKFGLTIIVLISSLNYKTKELPIGFVKGYKSNKSYYTKKNGKLELSKEKDNSGSFYFKDHEDIISNLYDELLPFENFKNSNFYSENITPVNSNFKVNIYNYKIDIFVPNNNTESALDYFKLEAFSFDDNYNCDSIDKELIKIFSKIEENYFKKVFVKIEDCPKWMQQELYTIRQEQLNYKEENKKSKDKKLTKKLFTFLNK